MGLSYKIDHDHQVVHTRGWGILRASDFQDLYCHLHADPAFVSDYRSLVDLREVSEIAINSAGLNEAAATPIYHPDTKRAIVVANDSVYAVAQTYAAFNKGMGQRMSIFRDLESAQTWLDQGKRSQELDL